VSVVIPTRNRAERVVNALASVARQTWTTWEAIVVDDGSNDDTPAVLAEAAERDRRIRVVRHDGGRGSSVARNSGIALANGEMLAFLDDDDQWLPTKLREQVNYLVDHPDVGAVSCWQAIDDGVSRDALLFRGPTVIDYDDLCWDNFGGSASFCVWRRAAFRDEPRFDPANPSADDWDVWLQCAHQTSVSVVPQVLCRYTAHDGPRLTGSSPGRIEGRRRIVERFGASMTRECRAYHEACITLLEVDSGLSEAKVVARLLAQRRPRAAFALTSAAIAGRLGDRAGDPGRGARQLHRTINRYRRAR
jgi:hypothetical protein